jgi:secondary thiamine-phosphate synthase enzyme
VIELEIPTSTRQELVDITGHVAEAVKRSGVKDGACLVFVPHTTAGVLLNEAHDPAVKSDVIGHLEWLVPEEFTWGHGEGNAPAHVMVSLVGNSVTLPVSDGRLRLGTWQGVMLAEFDGPRQRKVWVTVLAAAQP